MACADEAHFSSIRLSACFRIHPIKVYCGKRYIIVDKFDDEVLQSLCGDKLSDTNFSYCPLSNLVS